MKTIVSRNHCKSRSVTSRRSRIWSLSASCIACVAVLSLISVGCTSAKPDSQADGGGQAEEHGHDHDHGHRPESYSAALAQIKHARDEVKAAFDAGDPHACDEALHQVAEVLDVLPEVAAETDLPKEDWQVVKEQSKLLFDEFMKIHHGFHGDGKEEGASFDSVAESINAAIDALEEKVAATGEKAESASDDHDHEGHDHEGHDHEGHDHEDHAAETE